jgi:hypothetical protein
VRDGRRLWVVHRSPPSSVVGRNCRNDRYRSGHSVRRVAPNCELLFLHGLSLCTLTRRSPRRTPKTPDTGASRSTVGLELGSGTVANLLPQPSKVSEAFHVARERAVLGSNRVWAEVERRPRGTLPPAPRAHKRTTGYPRQRSDPLRAVLVSGTRRGAIVPTFSPLSQEAPKRGMALGEPGAEGVSSLSVEDRKGACFARRTANSSNDL